MHKVAGNGSWELGTGKGFKVAGLDNDGLLVWQLAMQGQKHLNDGVMCGCCVWHHIWVITWGSMMCHSPPQRFGWCHVCGQIHLGGFFPHGCKWRMQCPPDRVVGCCSCGLGKTTCLGLYEWKECIYPLLNVLLNSCKSCLLPCHCRWWGTQVPLSSWVIVIWAR